MGKNEKEFKLENSGTNSGAIVGQNYGTMVVQMQSSLKIPSHLAIIVKTLGSTDFNLKDNGSATLNVFKPEDKLDYNCVIQFKEIISEYATYYTHCDDILNLYDNSNIGGKNRILLWVRTCYLECKGELMMLKKDYESEIDVVRENSDFLISAVARRIKDVILKSADIINTSYEDIDLGVYCFICYCFMECKILERPL